MKSFHLTVWSVIVLFALVMGCVAVGSFVRKTNACRIDPSQMARVRNLSKR